MTAPHRIEPTALASAFGAGLEFLLRQQADTGAWRDFLLPAGVSDLWVTGYVGSALAACDHAGATAAAARGWALLARTELAGGGWSYNGSVPGDGDSTLWGLRLANQLGHGQSERVGRELGFLHQHLRPDGGLSTYARPPAIRHYVGLPATFSFAGWTQSHVCVSAAGACLPVLGPGLRAYLRPRQLPSGQWRAYWWFADEYATCEAVAALAVAPAADGAPPDDRDGDAERIRRAAVWAQARILAMASTEVAKPPAFALALAVRTLLHAPFAADTEAVHTGLERLLAWQRPDGSWPASARLRVPRPDSTDPDSTDPDGQPAAWRMWRGLPAGAPSLEAIVEHTFQNYSLDHQRVFTTAAVLRTIDMVRQRARDPNSP